MKRTILYCMIVVVVCLSFVFYAKPAAAEPTLIELGDLGGGQSEATDINNHGQVVGYSLTDRGYHAFFWEKGNMMDLGDMDGFFTWTIATGINDAGQVIGYGIIADFDGAMGFLWEDGKMILLGNIVDPFFREVDINNQGYVVGSAPTEDGDIHAFLYRKGKTTDLKPLGYNGLARAINESGWIAGTLEVSPGVKHAVIWKNNTLTDIGTLGGDEAYSREINNKGDVIGWSKTESGARHAFIWKDGVLVDLEKDMSDSYLTVEDINNQGQVVGFGQIMPERDGAFLWEDGVFTDLGMDFAYGINEQGQIVGSSTTADGSSHAVMWTR